MRGEIFLSETRSVCPECLRTISAARLARGDEVVLGKECPEHGRFETVIWRGSPSFKGWEDGETGGRGEREVFSPPPPLTPSPPLSCPRDCGLCPEHRQHTCTALIEVTQRCNLRCAYCFADGGNVQAEDPGLDAIEASFERLLQAGGPYNVQLSGGEPTLRDDLPEIIAMGRSMGFDFIQVNTNGLRVASDSAYAGELKDAGAASLFLQFDGLSDSIYARLRGRPLLKEKQLTVENCANRGLGVVLVPTLVPGVNDGQIGDIIRFGLEHLPSIRGVHFQPVSYFGRYPAPPCDAGRITLPEVLRAIETQTGGMIKSDNFKPPGCENAYCSFHGNFVLLEKGDLRALTRRAADEACCKQAPSQAGAVQARSFVSRVWTHPSTEASACCTEPTTLSLGGWDMFLDRARTHSFSISAMAFQDSWNLDLERLKQCCIHVAHPDGRIIPFCAYNLTDSRGGFMHREKVPQGA
jgi:7,8-dihydro-6-hydroxymethylpterin dimethyltransferase